MLLQPQKKMRNGDCWPKIDNWWKREHVKFAWTRKLTLFSYHVDISSPATSVRRSFEIVLCAETASGERWRLFCRKAASTATGCSAHERCRRLLNVCDKSYMPLFVAWSATNFLTELNRFSNIMSHLVAGSLVAFELLSELEYFNEISLC